MDSRNRKVIGVAAVIVLIISVVSLMNRVRVALKPKPPSYIKVIKEGQLDFEGRPLVIGVPIEEIKIKYGYTDAELRKMDYTITVKEAVAE